MNTPPLKTRLLFAAAVVSCALSGCSHPDVPWSNHRPWQMSNPVQNAGTPENPIPLGILEFDDQGELWRNGEGEGEARSQLGPILKKLREEAGKQPVALVIFCHGWNNNSKEGNGNLTQFKKTLQAMDATVVGKNQRTFGVFVSWRGHSASAPTGIDYYNREASAVKIGRVEATGALQALCSTAKRNSGSRVMAIGHSFGGLILLRTVAQPLVAQVADLASQKNGNFGTLHPMADTIVVVNPADNSILARQLVNSLTDFKVRYRKNGRDVPLIVSVTARDDRATRVFYTGASSIARYVMRPFMTSSAGKTSSWDQEWATVTSIGFHQKIHSHELVRADGLAEPPSVLRKEDFERDSLERLIKSNTRPGIPGQGKLVVWLDPQNGGNGNLEPYFVQPLPEGKNRRSNHTPYWIMQVPKFVSGSHGDIWNANFTGFLTAIHQASFEAPAATKDAPPAAPPGKVESLLSAPEGVLDASPPN